MNRYETLTKRPAVTKHGPVGPFFTTCPFFVTPPTEHA